MRQAVTGRTARYGGNALVMSLAFVGILVLINLLSARHHKRFDLTATQEYSLSPQTRQVLHSLEQPVQITAFMGGAYSNAQPFEDLIKEYTAQSAQLRYEIVDPDLKPSLARQYGIQSYNTIVYESGDKRYSNMGIEERDITASLLHVTSVVTKTVYFITGHGEHDLSDTTEPGISQLGTMLEQEGYAVQPLNLAITSTIPADCAAIVIARPMTKLLDAERSALQTYLASAGKALVLSDPTLDTGLNDLLAPYGVRYADDVVVDPASSLMGDVGVPVAQKYPYHVITKDLAATLYPQAGSVEIMGDNASQPEGASVTPLVQSSASSWGETDLQGERVRYDQGVDHQGPRNLAVTVQMAAPLLPTESEQRSSTETRLVVLGDSDFASNAFIASLGNADLALNAISWLTEEEALISIRPKETTRREVTLTAGEARLVMLSSMVFLPLAVLVAGLAVWWNRR